VGARYADALTKPIREGGKEIGTGGTGHTVTACRKERGIIGRDGKRKDNKVGLGSGLSPLLGQKNGDARKPEDEGPLPTAVGIRAADKVAALGKHSGKRAHPHTANANKMHTLRRKKDAGQLASCKKRSIFGRHDTLLCAKKRRRVTENGRAATISY
jgi:hypothetical protein